MEGFNDTLTQTGVSNDILIGAKAQTIIRQWPLTHHNGHCPLPIKGRPMQICARTACDRQIVNGAYVIHNDPPRPPRTYCASCGKKIVFHNPTLIYTRIGYVPSSNTRAASTVEYMRNRPGNTA